MKKRWWKRRWPVPGQYHPGCKSICISRQLFNYKMKKYRIDRQNLPHLTLQAMFASSPQKQTSFPLLGEKIFA
jgi:hypothetical protein